MLYCAIVVIFFLLARPGGTWPSLAPGQVVDGFSSQGARSRRKTLDHNMASPDNLGNEEYFDVEDDDDDDDDDEDDNEDEDGSLAPRKRLRGCCAASSFEAPEGMTTKRTRRLEIDGEGGDDGDGGGDDGDNVKRLSFVTGCRCCCLLASLLLLLALLMPTAIVSLAVLPALKSSTLSSPLSSLSSLTSLSSLLLSSSSKSGDRDSDARDHPDVRQFTNDDHKDDRGS